MKADRERERGPGLRTKTLTVKGEEEEPAKEKEKQVGTTREEEGRLPGNQIKKMFQGKHQCAVSNAAEPSQGEDREVTVVMQ